MTIQELKDLWFYIIQTDDGDRYLREVYANHQLEYIASSREEAEDKLEQLFTSFNS